VTFLELNGMMFSASEESVVEQTLGLASGDIKEPKYATWLKAHSNRA
jgi:prophage maintenance system killer protein